MVQIQCYLARFIRNVVQFGYRLSVRILHCSLITIENAKKRYDIHCIKNKQLFDNSLLAESFGIDSEQRSQNFIADMTHNVDGVIKFLLYNDINIQILAGAHPSEITAAVQSKELLNILNLLTWYSKDGLSLSVRFSGTSPTECKNAPVYINFVDSLFIYMHPTLKLDPWYCLGDLIQSDNFNTRIMQIQRYDINKTVYYPRKKINDKPQESIVTLPKSLLHEIDFPVDIVYTWVDGSDDEWRQKFIKYCDVEIERNITKEMPERYFSFDELRYSLRSVYSFLKDIRNIYIVTDQQKPEWLDPNYKNIHIIDHREILNGICELPTFNSHAIEANLHRISGLSEHFIYFNDDFILWHPMSRNDFFYSNGISIAYYETIGKVYASGNLKQAAWKKAAIRANKCILRKYGAWCYSYHHHAPYVMRKSVMQKMWKIYGKELGETCSHRVRNAFDVSPASFLYPAFAYANAVSVNRECVGAVVDSSDTNHLRMLWDNVYKASAWDFLCIHPKGSMKMTQKILKMIDYKFNIPAPWEK